MESWRQNKYMSGWLLSSPAASVAANSEPENNQETAKYKWKKEILEPCFTLWFLIVFLRGLCFYVLYIDILCTLWKYLIVVRYERGGACQNESFEDPEYCQLMSWKPDSFYDCFCEWAEGSIPK